MIKKFTSYIITTTFFIILSVDIGAAIAGYSQKRRELKSKDASSITRIVD